MEFVNQNKLNFTGKNALNFNIYFEQVLFYELAKIQNQKIDYLFEDVSLDNDYKGFGDFDKVPNKTYLHLFGDYKRNATVCKAMEVGYNETLSRKLLEVMKLINIQENSINEIDFLNTKKISELLLEFENEVTSYTISEDNFLLKRDFFVKVYR